MNQYWSPLGWDKLFNASILYIISEKRLLRSMSGRCVIGNSGNSKHTLVTALSLWYSAGVYRRHSVYVWVLGAVGDYIHPAAGCPRGEGGNVIYTLIMPAPLNTPPDRCNILDISTSFFPLQLPFSLSFPSFRLDPPLCSPEPHADIYSPHHEYRAAEVQGAAVITPTCSRMCAECAKQDSASRSGVPSLAPNPHHHPIKTHPLLLLPVLLHINLFPGDQGKCNPAATPHRHLPWGIKGWLSRYCLSQWDYLLSAAAHYDTCFHSLTHALPLLFLPSSHLPSFSISLHLSLFISTCGRDLPSDSVAGTLHWRAGECQEFLPHFHWPRAESSSGPGMLIGLEAHINEATRQCS